MGRPFFSPVYEMSENTQFSGLTKRVNVLAELVLQNRIARALDAGSARYPIYRVVRFAARIELDVLLDAMALDPTWRVERLHAEALLLDGEGLFVSGYGSRKADYSSCIFYVWAADVARAEAAKAKILAKAGPTLITEPMFSIEWNFLTSQGELESAVIDEMANDVLHDRAYPEIKGGVRGFIER